MKSTIEIVRPTVKKPGGTIAGKGYSWEEISAAGFTRFDIHKIGIFFDKRRKTIHDANVEALRKLKK